MRHFDLRATWSKMPKMMTSRLWWPASRGLRALIWGFAGVLALWLLSWLLVPPLLKHQVQKRASEAIGRTVSIGHIDFRPWTLELTVSDLRIGTAPGAATQDPPQVQFSRIYIDAELQSILRLAPVVDAVLIEGLVARVAHTGEGTYDFDDIVKRLAPGDGKPAGDPARFAVYNLEVRDASLVFDDRPVQRRHELSDLHLSIPFLSNLPSQREVKVKPRLAFKLNGSGFDSNAEATPFAQDRKTDLRLQLKSLDLAPYLVYLPKALPVKLLAAVIDADLNVSFVQAQGTSIDVKGSLDISGLRLADHRSRDLLAFEKLHLELGSLRPLEQHVHLSAVELTAPRFQVQREADGNLGMVPQTPLPAQQPVGQASTPTPNWKLQVDSLALRAGSLQWLDDATSPKAQVTATDVNLDVKNVAWPFRPTAEGGKVPSFEGKLALQGSPGSGSGAKMDKPGGTLAFKGSGTDQDVKVTLGVAGLELAMGAPYLKTFLNPALTGRLDADLDVVWNPVARQLKVHRTTIAGLALGAEKEGLASMARFELAEGLIDLGKSEVLIGKVVLQKPNATVQRDKEGRWMYEAWLKPQAEGAAAGPTNRPDTGKAAPTPPWSVTITDFSLSDGAVALRDDLPAKPVSLDLSEITLQLRHFRPLAAPVASKAAVAVKPTQLSLAARMSSGQGAAGNLSYKGVLALAPLSTRGSVEISDLPVHALEPYWRDMLNVELLRADASFKGDLAFADESRPGGPTATRIRLTGDASVEELRAMTYPSGAGSQVQGAEELLTWKILSLRGLDVTLTPESAPQVAIAQTVLTDFYARVIIDPQGRINLQDLVKSGTASGPANPASAPVAVATPASAPVVATSAKPNIAFGPVSLVNGRVQFSDRFVRPNYTAGLSELTGRLSAFSSQSPQLADLDLRGRAEGTASLEITGQLNPLATPLALDIKAKVRDLELSPMSPYAVKYAGHGIQRGKLSLDVAYLVKPDGQLTASNKLVLNQLTFGDKIEGAPNSLPVKLAVALLADRNGVIDIDLPISGSLNDPEFKLGPIIFKVIVNLIVKAITAPFSLLASAFGGGGDELGMVAFGAGSVGLNDKAREGLDKVAKALMDRPALKMTVQGEASLEVERDALKRERLQGMVEAEKRRAMVQSGATAATTPQAGVVVQPAEYPALLAQVYRRSEMPKPLDSAGKLKELPVEEMEALLMSYIRVDDEAMRELALRRGVAVRDYLAARAVPLDRLFLGQTRLAAADGKWTPRAELTLATP